MLRPDLYGSLYDPADEEVYLTTIRPRRFLELALPDSEAERQALIAQVGPFDPARVAEWEDLPHLEIDPELNQVTGHEGRHRMAAMINSGIEEASVVIELISVRLAVRLGYEGRSHELLERINAWHWNGPRPDLDRVRPEEPINEIARRESWLKD